MDFGAQRSFSIVLFLARANEDDSIVKYMEWAVVHGELRAEWSQGGPERHDVTLFLQGSPHGGGSFENLPLLRRPFFWGMGLG